MTEDMPTTADAQRAIAKFEQDFPVEATPYYEITDQDDYDAAGQRLRAIKGKTKDLKEQKDLLVKPINAAHKAIFDLFAHPESKLGKMEKALKDAMLRFEAEEQRKRLARQRQLQEAQRQSEAEVAAQADALMDKGLLDEAEDLLTTLVPSFVVVPTVARPKGISKRMTWKAEVTDRKALMASGRVEFLEVNEKALNQFARATSGLVEVPGVRFYEEETIASTSI